MVEEFIWSGSQERILRMDKHKKFSETYHMLHRYACDMQ